MSRIVHRLGAFVAVLLTLWLSVTGSTIQLLDLKTVLSHASPTDPTAVSMAEGMYGPANFAVIQLSDFSAAPLPADLDIPRAIDSLLQASGASAAKTWVELRVNGGKPVGQVMDAQGLSAFDARTGQPVAATTPVPIPQGARLPPSLRQKLKTLHRFWNRGDTPGVYCEFLAGLVLWTLLITGLLMYFRLLNARMRVGRRRLFWSGGGTWRELHRAVSIVAAVFLICIAASGTWIGFESSWNALGRSAPARPARAAGVGRTNQSAGLDDADVRSMAAFTLRAMERLHPRTPIKVLRLRTYGQMRQGVVIAGGSSTQQLVFDAANGQPASLTEPSYPRSGFPLGTQVHENVKHFHSGEMFGIPGQLMNLFAGVSLLFLSVSGLAVYFEMWNRRRRAGRAVLVWVR